MPRLRVLSGREVCRILTSHGCSEARRRGSQIIMQKVEQESTISVPVPDHKALRTGTL
ncbi:MAG: type II toxin-antitoxin system HicA family toxin [Caldilineaceae bacterium SB0670_bin_27]|uniref:Type II toxin-antitoxin system HicA family toxin n=1 Tax=Caldilineaceae bacterium SB0664_bin_27 TaxID=2605260 RepID=A0A6B0YVY4_9CHLR|nr:type II toxin-antitoxin system HicA family toxin [Caldilineaceae bacterium SB0664_bin_27]MYJ79863.1 type II toxin-antitoxin system HicA family toxin [Caldilineaceae bacterium SB0670_bin_27]